MLFGLILITLSVAISFLYVLPIMVGELKEDFEYYKNMPDTDK